MPIKKWWFWSVILRTRDKIMRYIKIYIDTSSTSLHHPSIIHLHQTISLALYHRIMYSTAQNNYSNVNSACINIRAHICSSNHTVDDRSDFVDSDQSSRYSSSPISDFAVLPASGFTSFCLTRSMEKSPNLGDQHCRTTGIKYDWGTLPGVLCWWNTCMS
jgi:hypothetical protein